MQKDRRGLVEVERYTIFSRSFRTKYGRLHLYDVEGIDPTNFTMKKPPRNSLQAGTKYTPEASENNITEKNYSINTDTLAIEKAAEESFGTTYNWDETGYS